MYLYHKRKQKRIYILSDVSLQTQYSLEGRKRKIYTSLAHMHWYYAGTDPEPQ
jgi:hypothetical protein